MSEGLSTEQKEADSGNLKEYTTVLLFELSQKKQFIMKIVLGENRGLTSRKSMDFGRCYVMDYPIVMLYPSVTLEWMDEGQLLKEGINLEVVEAL